MKIKKVKIKGYFVIEEPIKIFNAIENGDTGYINFSSVLLIKKEQKTFVRIHKEAGLWADETATSLLHVKLNQDQLIIKILSKDPINIDTDIEGEYSKFWTECIEVPSINAQQTEDEVIPEITGNDIANNILGFRSTDLATQHDLFTDYCYSRGSIPDNAKIAFIELKRRAPEKILDTRIDTITLIVEDCTQLLEGVINKAKAFKARYNEDLFKTTPQLGYLNEYVRYMIMLGDSAIESRFDEDSLSSKSEEELLILFNAELDPIRKEEIGKELAKKYS